IDRANGADEFGKVFAVARGVIESIQPSIAESFGQSDATRESAIGKDKFVPLNRRDLVVETRDRPTAEKCAGCFGWGKDRGLDLFLFGEASNRSLTRQLVIQTGFKIDIVIFEIDRLQPWIAPGKFFFFLQSIEQKFLGHPIDAVARSHDITLEIIQNIFPFSQNPLSIFGPSRTGGWRFVFK